MPGSVAERALNRRSAPKASVRRLTVTTRLVTPLREDHELVPHRSDVRVGVLRRPGNDVIYPGVDHGLRETQPGSHRDEKEARASGLAVAAGDRDADCRHSPELRRVALCRAPLRRRLGAQNAGGVWGVRCLSRPKPTCINRYPRTQQS